MGLFSLEQSPAVYRADFVVHGLSALGLLAVLVWDQSATASHLSGPATLAWCASGLLGWSAIEYAMHRYVFHHVPPFQRLHAEHHARPQARIGTPTALSSALIFGGVFLPTAWLADGWRASALTLGLLAGYLAYSVVHHAVHHWRANSEWLRRRKRWHAMHHHQTARSPSLASAGCCYGVTTSLWDRLLGSGPVSRLTTTGPP